MVVITNRTGRWVDGVKPVHRSDHRETCKRANKKGPNIRGDRKEPNSRLTAGVAPSYVFDVKENSSPCQTWTT